MQGHGRQWWAGKRPSLFNTHKIGRWIRHQQRVGFAILEAITQQASEAGKIYRPCAGRVLACTQATPTESQVQLLHAGAHISGVLPAHQRAFHRGTCRRGRSRRAQHGKAQAIGGGPLLGSPHRRQRRGHLGQARQLLPETGEAGDGQHFLQRRQHTGQHRRLSALTQLLFVHQQYAYARARQKMQPGQIPQQRGGRVFLQPTLEQQRGGTIQPATQAQHRDFAVHAARNLKIHKGALPAAGTRHG